MSHIKSLPIIVLGFPFLLYALVMSLNEQNSKNNESYWFMVQLVIVCATIYALGVLGIRRLRLSQKNELGLWVLLKSLLVLPFFVLAFAGVSMACVDGGGCEPRNVLGSFEPMYFISILWDPGRLFAIIMILSILSVAGLPFAALSQHLLNRSKRTEKEA